MSNIFLVSTLSKFQVQNIVSHNLVLLNLFQKRKAVSTSHCTQPNHIVEPMAFEWLALQAKSESMWKKLSEVCFFFSFQSRLRTHLMVPLPPVFLSFFFIHCRYKPRRLTSSGTKTTKEPKEMNNVQKFPSLNNTKEPLLVLV